MPETTILNVGMTCGGCSSAVERILGKMEEVSSVETDVPNKKVTIVSEGITDKNVFVEKLKSWSTASGKSVELADCCK